MLRVLLLKLLGGLVQLVDRGLQLHLVGVHLTWWIISLFHIISINIILFSLSIMVSTPDPSHGSKPSSRSHGCPRLPEGLLIIAKKLISCRKFTLVQFSKGSSPPPWIWCPPPWWRSRTCRWWRTTGLSRPWSTSSSFWWRPSWFLVVEEVVWNNPYYTLFSIEKE